MLYLVYEIKGRTSSGHYAKLEALAAFVFGYGLSLDGRFWKAIDRHYVLALLLTVVLSGIKLVLISEIESIRPEGMVTAYSSDYFIYSIVVGFNAWFRTIALLGLARRFLCFNNLFLKYFNRASYPYLHIASNADDL